MQIFKSPNYNFVGLRWHALALSIAIIAIGLGTIWQRGLPLGVEFAGGTLVIVQFEQMPQIQQIRAALAAVPGGEAAVVQQYGEAAQREVMIRIAEVGEERAGELSSTADAVLDSLRQADLGEFTVVGTEIVGPIVGDQLKRQGLLATILALAGILAYIAIRFQFSFAVGAVVATVHDLLVTLTFLVIFQSVYGPIYDLTLNVIAAMLAITGYSVNDTIVVFDRVRENLRSMRRDNLTQIVNTSVNQTLGRTVITSGTSLIAVLALFLFGGEVLRGFAFTMLVGVIAGTYSTVFIASSIAIMMQGRKPLKGQAAVATTPAARKPRRRAS